MAGHSQFANIKHRKGAQDAKRSKRFTKLRREIIVAARDGVPDIEKNSRLRSVVQNAKREGLPKDRIESAIKSASGSILSENYQEVLYEGYGVSGIAVLLTTLTDNRNRTASDLRYIFSKFGGNLAESGSVAFMFDYFGKIVYDSYQEVDQILDFAIELGAQDVTESKGQICILCAKPDFYQIAKRLAEKFREPAFSGLVWIAKDPISLQEDDAETINKMMEAFQDNDDVQYMVTNHC